MMLIDETSNLCSLNWRLSVPCILAINLVFVFFSILPSIAFFFVLSFSKSVSDLSSLQCFQWAVETEVFHKELAEVRSELQPWENELIEHKGKLEVACTESKLLSEKVSILPMSTLI